ncbi:hypothetical protein COOONC_02253 [Cooperia oncophora]
MSMIEDTFIRLISPLSFHHGRRDGHLYSDQNGENSSLTAFGSFFKKNRHASALPDSEFTRLMNETLSSYPLRYIVRETARIGCCTTPSSYHALP